MGSKRSCCCCGLGPLLNRQKPLLPPPHFQMSHSFFIASSSSSWAAAKPMSMITSSWSSFRLRGSTTVEYQLFHWRNVCQRANHQRLTNLQRSPHTRVCVCVCVWRIDGCVGNWVYSIEFYTRRRNHKYGLQVNRFGGGASGFGKDTSQGGSPNSIHATAAITQSALWCVDVCVFYSPALH